MGKEATPRAKQIAIKRGKKSLAMAEGTATLGAARDCLYRVSGPKINDHHVNLDFNGAVVTVSAANEAEGITVNGKPLTKPQQVKPGDILAFGAHSFEIGNISNAPGAFRRTLRRWYIRYPLYAGAGMLGLLLIAFVIAWIYLSPDRISGWITEAVDQQLNCTSKIGQLDYSFSGRLEITDFEILNKPEYGDDAILSIAKMDAQVSIWDILFSKLRLKFTGTDPKLKLVRKLIAGKPSYNFEPLLPTAATPDVPPPPAPPRVPGEPIDIGLKDEQFNIAVTNLEVTVIDELMKRETHAKIDIAVDTDGGGKPVVPQLTCLVDSNGRSGKIALKAEANLFDKQGRIVLSSATGAWLDIKPGDMVNSLPLQALIDHLSLPIDKNQVFTADDLPMAPNLLGSPLALNVQLTDPSRKNPDGTPVVESVAVNLARLGDLGISWTALTIKSLEPLAVEIAGTVDIGEVGRHRAPVLAGQAVGDWIEGDKLHFDLKKCSIDQTAQTIALDAELTLSNSKQGQMFKAQVTTAASQFNLAGLQAADAAEKNAAIRLIQFDKPQAQIELNAVAFANSGLGQLLLAGKKAQLANLTSGSLAGTVSIDGDLTKGLHILASTELKDVTYVVTPENTLSKAGLNVLLEANVSLNEDFLPTHVTVSRANVDLGLGGNRYTICDIQALKSLGWDQLLKSKDLSALSAVEVTAEKMKVADLSKDLVAQLNPVLKSLLGVELHDTVLITGSGDLKNENGSVKLGVFINRIDAATSGLSPAAAQPIDIQLALEIAQTTDKKKQIGLEVTGTHGVKFFHVGMQSPPVQNLGDLDITPWVFTQDTAPWADLLLQPLVERARIYLANQPNLLARLDSIDFSAGPRAVLTTRTLQVNQPVNGSAELQTLWEFSLGLRNIQDRAQDGKTILPGKTDFTLDGKLNPVYGWRTVDQQRTLESLRIPEATLKVNNEYISLDYAFSTADLLACFMPGPAPVDAKGQLIQDANGHNLPAPTLMTKLPAQFHARGVTTVRKEAYELVRVLLKGQVELQALTQNQEAVMLTFDGDWDVANPAEHDRLQIDFRTQIDPFHSAEAADQAGGFHEGRLKLDATGLLARLPFPLDVATLQPVGAGFNPVAFAFQSQAALDFTTPISLDQLVMFAHNNAVTLHLDQDDLINTINTPLSPLAVSGIVRAEVHLAFDGKGTARAAVKVNLDDLYLLGKNEGALRQLEVIKAKNNVPLFIHERRSKDSQADPLQIGFVVNAAYAEKDKTLTLRMDDKENGAQLGPITMMVGATVVGELDGANLKLKTADFNKEVVVDLSQVAVLAPLTTDLNLSGRLHVKAAGQGLDLGKLLAAAPAPVEGAPVVPPLFNPNLNPTTYTVYSAPELTVQPKTAPKTKLQLGLKNITGDLGGNKTGEITLTVTDQHVSALQVTGLRAVAKLEAGSFMNALQTYQLRANLKVANAEPLYLTEMTGIATPCMQSLGLPEPPPAPATPPPAGEPLKPGALDFIKPVTANLELDLKNLHYDRYEVDALKGAMVLDQGEFTMPEPPTATIYGGTAKVDLRVVLVGASPNIPKIKMDIQDLDYDEFFRRAFEAPGSVGGKMHVHIEGTGNSALNPDIDSLSLTTITTQSAGTEITDITKTPFVGVLWSSAAQLFPKALPANPGPIKFGSQTLKNGKLENGYFTFSEFPFVPEEGPLLGYKLVGEGKIKVMTAHAEFVTFKVTAVPDKVMDELVATARQSLLVEANKLIPDKKYQLTDADLDEAAQDMRTQFQQFMADGKLFVRGRGPLSHPTPEVTPPQAVADMLLKVGMNVVKKKVEAIAKKIAEEKLKEGIGNLLGPRKKK